MICFLKKPSYNSWIAQQVNAYYQSIIRGVQKLMKLLQKSFYRGQEKCHSRLHFNHANFRAPKSMNEMYKAVALELGDGITIRSASNFRNKAIALAEKPTAETETVATVSAVSTTPVPATAPVPVAHAAPVPAEQTTTAEMEDVADLPELKPRGVESNPGTTVVTTWTSEALMSFLGDHWDTHALPTTFFSLSSQDSFVYYKKDKEVVAQLLIPAGFSIVVTTEIHSGLKTLNPHKLKHYSESTDDRLRFRIVHELPTEGIDMMSCTSEDWIEFATNAVNKIFNRQK
jgi:hypothetical protein